MLYFHNINLQWVKAHEGNLNNERADILAKLGANSIDPLIDHVYESFKRTRFRINKTV